MRRPLKPFVTEYKGRGSQPLTARRAHEDHAAAPSVNDPFLRHPPEPAHQAEDSYEAALRAADALFSNPAKQDGPPASAEGAPATSHAPPPRGGRILRAIDEAPLPGLAELEEERAPKRRGRKPGSKNKPKPFAASPAPAKARPAPAKKPKTGFQWPDEDPAPALRPVRTPEPVFAAQAAQISPKRPKGPVPGFASRQDSRFGWVKTKLPPGQEWKRRLPKVCW